MQLFIRLVFAGYQINFHGVDQIDIQKHNLFPNLRLLVLKLAYLWRTKSLSSCFWPGNTRSQGISSHNIGLAHDACVIKLKWGEGKTTENNSKCFFNSPSCCSLLFYFLSQWIMSGLEGLFLCIKLISFKMVIKGMPTILLKDSLYEMCFVSSLNLTALF